MYKFLEVAELKNEPKTQSLGNDLTTLNGIAETMEPERSQVQGESSLLNFENLVLNTSFFQVSSFIIVFFQPFYLYSGAQIPIMSSLES